MRTAMAVMALALAPIAMAQPNEPEQVPVMIEDVFSTSTARACEDERPESQFDFPLCADEDMHTLLIEAARGGDRSALELLRQRYETADTYRERHRIAAVLLERLPNSDAIWNALAEEASIALRFPRRENGGYSDELEAYCEERDLDSGDVWEMSVDALATACESPRARTLLHDALRSEDGSLVNIAIIGFVMQHDASALPAIAAALEHYGDGADDLAMNLAFFELEEADAIAFKYLNESQRETYLDSRIPVEPDDPEEEEEEESTEPR